MDGILLLVAAVLVAGAAVAAVVLAFGLARAAKRGDRVNPDREA